MKKQKLSTPSLTFEELDQEDPAMKRIFEEIQKFPDKEKSQKINLRKSFQSPQRSSKKFSHKPDQELDLHGKTRDESILMVQNFVMTCHAKKYRSGLIITGKGHNSGEKGPILKREVKLWLERNGKTYLKDFHEAPPRFGGSGAIWLIFKEKN